jgi:hypothetical protein
MRRRAFLQLAVGSLAGTAAAATTGGYLDVFGGSTAGDGSGLDTSASSLSLSTVETFDHVVRLNDLGEDPRGRISAFSDLEPREREVVIAVFGGTYEAEDPPEWLWEFASATPFVERADTYYRLDDTFPTYRVTAEAVTESEVDGEIAPYEEYDRAVTREDYVMSGLLRIARREGVELSYVWPSLRNFFDAYDAARYHGEVVSFSVDLEDAGPPHEISATEVPVSEAVGGAVWRADAAPKRTRELLDRAGRARGAYGFDRAPAGLLENLRSHRYVRLDGAFYTSRVESRGSPPISVSAEFRGGRLRLAARNDADSSRRLSSGPPRPFGIVRCRAKENSASTSNADAEASLLWTDAYAESDHVRTEGREIGPVNDVALVSTLAPGETVAEDYAIPDLPHGEYVVEGSLGVAAGSMDDADTEDEDSTVRYRVTFSVA